MKKIATPLILVGLVAWTAAWLGSGFLILNALFKDEKK